jgi:3-oxoacyl-[acyl-carrier protein] reductase
MGDFLLGLRENPYASKAIRRLGLPIPLPPVLRRATGPWKEKPLRDDYVIVGGTGLGRLTPAIAATVAHGGANALVDGDMDVLSLFRKEAVDQGTDAHRVFPDAIDPQPRVAALVFDATGIADVAGLSRLHAFFHPLVSRVRPSGRIVVLGTPPSACGLAEQAAVQQGLDGFVRSLAKEVGKKGTTAGLVQVEPGAEENLEGILRFVLSTRSAFVTGQTIGVRSLLKAGPWAWTRPLEGQVAVVTGAARGIGAATAGALAVEGAHVLCVDRPEDADGLRAVAARVGGSALPLDITSPGAADTLATRLLEGHGGVDVLVHNAGITRDKTLARMSADRWDAVLDVNLGAVLRVNARLMDGVLRDGGRIVCLSSMAGIAGNLGQTNYTASKAGIIGYVRHLAEQLVDRGIAVHAVAPGFIETRMTAAIPFAIREVGRRASSLGQGGLPEDVADVITFLATPCARGMTGAVLRVCGGSLLGA